VYENLTPEQIKSDILGDLRLADTREGSYTNTLISPVAHEFWKIYQDLDSLDPKVFPDETSGIYIDKNANPFGVTRKPGTKAGAAVAFFGADGTVIQKGKVFLTEDSLQYTLDANVIISGGVELGHVTAAEIGEKYNVHGGEIYRQLVNQSGIERIESAATTGGADAETNAAYVTRYNNYRRRPPTSGNPAHYEQWATEVDGVGAVKVIPLAYGPGTVKVLIVGPDNQPLDETIVANTAAHIENVRPIGADVTVMSAAGRAIDVTARVIIKPSTNASAVKEAFTQELNAHLRKIAFSDYLVVYNRVGYILLDVPGVIDFTQLTVNGTAADVVIGADEVPVPGSIEVTV